MGATGWNYFAPYEIDAETVLQRLRQRVFKEGKYGSGILAPDQLKAVFEHVLARSPDAAQTRQQMEEAMSRLGQLRKQMPQEPPNPNTIKKLLKKRAENGTHSILDMLHVSSTPDFGAVSPMPATRLFEIFGTDKPTRSMVES